VIAGFLLLAMQASGLPSPWLRSLGKRCLRSNGADTWWLALVWAPVRTLSGREDATRSAIFRRDWVARLRGKPELDGESCVLTRTFVVQLTRVVARDENALFALLLTKISIRMSRSS
jgi:hypothetical protein